MKLVHQKKKAEILKMTSLNKAVIQTNIISEEHNALPAVYLTVHMCNLDAALHIRHFSSLRRMSLNSADKSFL